MVRQQAYKTPPYPVGEIPRFIINEYPEDVTDIVEEIKSHIYWHMLVPALKYKSNEEFVSRPEGMGGQEWFNIVFSHTPEGEKSSLLNELIEKSFSKAAEVADSNQSKFSRAFLKVLSVINEHGMYRSQGECGNIEEYVMDRFPRLEPGSGEFSEVMFMINEMFPLLKEFGKELGVDEILSEKELYGKVRGSVAYVRASSNQFKDDFRQAEIRVQEIERKESDLEQSLKTAKPEKAPIIQAELEAVSELKKSITKDAEIQKASASEKLRENVVTVIGALKDKSIGANGVNGIRNHLKREGKSIMFKGMVSLAPGRSVFYLDVPEQYQLAVERSLANFVEFQMTDKNIMIKEMEKKNGK